ncbi:acyl transferase [Rhodococcus sp. AH-ZY2]|uniref:acyl transferase n=1 Tax=Rhodococcus sp. AH-ZY2 TaxID=3047468 RepID=UPI0027E16C41|nr:acyl transferase [Rhodococcus sp. AH-ZY2]WML62148.1 acyl transferase [Rhodococcus sp. AH-ZY2]
MRFESVRLRASKTLAAVALSLGLVTSCGDTPPGPAPTTGVPASSPAPVTATTAGSTPVPNTSSTTATEDTTPPTDASFPGENLTPEEAGELQRAVDEGSRPWRLDPSLVAQAFVADRFGWSDTEARTADPHTVEVTDRTDGSIVVLQLRQPVREGADGIWVVTGGVRID